MSSPTKICKRCGKEKPIRDFNWPSNPPQNKESAWTQCVHCRKW